MHFIVAFAAIGILAGMATGHPGEDHQKEAARRREFLQHSPKDLSHCAMKMKARGLEAAAIQRRQERAKQLSKQGNLLERNLAADGDHKSNQNYTLDTPAEVIFGSNKACILSHEVTEGPYYVAGELIRQDVVDSQDGVLFYMDIQVVQMHNCEPLQGAYVEIWHSNATGVYSGVSADGNGNSANDKSNFDTTFLRGARPTNDFGVVIFDSIFPGHYAGRTPHVHVLVHMNVTAEANGTLRSTKASHVGQMFFDQNLINSVESTAVYKTNKQAFTTNDKDGVLADEYKAGMDPMMEYTLLGPRVEDGIFAWLSLGIDPAFERDVYTGTTFGQGGGHPNLQANTASSPQPEIPAILN